MEAAPRGRLDEIGDRAGDWTKLVAATFNSRHAAQEPQRVGMPGLAQDLSGRRHLDELASVHDANPVTRLGDDAEIVRDQNHAHAAIALQPHEKRQNLVLDRDVEGGRWLVGQQQAGIGGDRDRDHDALGHPPAELVRVVAQPLLGRRDADGPQQPDRLLASG